MLSRSQHLIALALLGYLGTACSPKGAAGSRDLSGKTYASEQHPGLEFVFLADGTGLLATPIRNINAKDPLRNQRHSYLQFRWRLESDTLTISRDGQPEEVMSVTWGTGKPETQAMTLKPCFGDPRQETFWPVFSGDEERH